MNKDEIRYRLHQLIEEVYEVTMDELPTGILQNIAIYAEATRTGIPMKNWANYRIRKDSKGFTIADDLFLELLLKTEKLFNITIEDEEAENIYTILELEKMITEEIKKKNRLEYFDAAIKIGDLKLILVGQDPYPDKIDNGIAFCKDKISDLKKTCFPKICNSLGIDFKNLETEFNNDGKKLFHHLLTKGIMFMNLSYELFAKGSNRKKLINDYHEENQKIINEFPHAKIIKLGLNYEVQFKSLYKSEIIIVHPSGLAKGHKKWDEYWGEDVFYLKNKFSL